jgi:hypothetical protein
MKSPPIETPTPMPTFAPVERLWDLNLIVGVEVDVGEIVGEDAFCVASVEGADVVGIEELEVVTRVLGNNVEEAELEVCVASEAKLEDTMLPYIMQTSSVIFFVAISLVCQLWSDSEKEWLNVLAKSAAEQADSTQGATASVSEALCPHEHETFLTAQPISCSPEVRQG